MVNSPQTRTHNIAFLRNLTKHTYYLYASETALLAMKGPYRTRKEAVHYAVTYLTEGQRWVVRNDDDQIVARPKKHAPLEGFDYED